MKASILPLVLFVSVITACNIDNGDKKVAVGLSNSKQIAFSDSVKLDSFKIESTGNKVDSMQLIFTITSFENKQIYREEIEVSNLLKGYLASADLKKESEKQKFIKEELELFLDDDNFLEPAVTENEKADQYTPDVAFYNELRQTQLNGFSYRLGKSTKIYIAWSKKEQKVKVYYKCC